MYLLTKTNVETLEKQDLHAAYSNQGVIECQKKKVGFSVHLSENAIFLKVFALLYGNTIQKPNSIFCTSQKGAWEVCLVQIICLQFLYVISHSVL